MNTVQRYLLTKFLGTKVIGVSADQLIFGELVGLKKMDDKHSSSIPIIQTPSGQLLYTMCILLEDTDTNREMLIRLPADKRYEFLRGLIVNHNDLRGLMDEGIEGERPVNPPEKTLTDLQAGIAYG